jgi:hypothetical protein
LRLRLRLRGRVSLNWRDPPLVNGNMAARMYDTFGRYLFVGFTAKY